MKYKLIKNYLGSPKVGFELNFTDGITLIKVGTEVYAEEEIAKYPDNWAVVIESEILKIDKWYKTKCNNFIYYSIQDCGATKGCGFDCKGKWFDGMSLIDINTCFKNWKTTYTKELKELFLSKAKKNYPIGTKFKNLFSGKSEGVVEDIPKFGQDNTLIFTTSFNFIYKDGVWAEIMEKPIFKDINGKFWYKSDFKKNGIYYCEYIDDKTNREKYIFRYFTGLKRKGNYIAFNGVGNWCKSERYIHGDNYLDMTPENGMINYRKATQDEIDWLERCEKAGKYVPKEKELPESWEDYRDSFNHIIAIPRHEPFTSMNKLILLRDAYRDDWKPDWTTTNKFKNIIQLHKNVWIVNTVYHINYPFSFQSKEIRDKFFKNFKDLLEQVKPLFT